jgi:hypothetical protein
MVSWLVLKLAHWRLVGSALAPLLNWVHSLAGQGLSSTRCPRSLLVVMYIHVLVLLDHLLLRLWGPGVRKGAGLSLWVTRSVVGWITGLLVGLVLRFVQG